jgi:thymidylate kinase
MDPRPGVGLVAAQPGSALPSRQGVIGWAWSLVVTAHFLGGLRRQHRASTGVVLYDRHIADALATLDFAYEGTDLRLQRWLVQTFCPPAAAVFYLEVPTETALARKPGDMIGEHAIRRQLAAYERWLPRLDRVRRLQASKPPDELVDEALSYLAGPLAS